jgi:hypothetical protein
MGGNRNKKQRIFERDHGICHYCAEDCVPFGEGKFNQTLSATLDHVQTKMSGGGNHDQNLVLACLRCNNMRSCIPYHIFKSQRLWNNPRRCEQLNRLFAIGAQPVKHEDAVYILEMYNETPFKNEILVQNWGVFASAQAVHVYMHAKFPDAIQNEDDSEGYIGYHFPDSHALEDVSFVANLWDLIR